MFKIIKICFSIMVVVMLLPEDAITDQNGAIIPADVTEHITQTSLKNVSEFCTKNPQACLEGKQTASELSQKTIKTARSIYNYLNESETIDEKLGLEKIPNTSSLDAIAMQIEAEQASSNTLSMSDLNIQFSENDLQ